MTAQKATAQTATARALNRATLERQLLTRRVDLSVGDAVRQIMALQAQHSASPYIALWNRINGLDPAAVDAALSGYDVVRATLMRMTLQLVSSRDYVAFRDAVEPTMYATHIDGRFTPAQLTPSAARKLLDGLVAHAATPRSADELKEWLAPRVGPVSLNGAWAILKSYAPLVRAPNGGPWSFGSRSCYVAAEPPPALDAATSDGPLEVLVTRFLSAYGPSTAADVGKFALVQQARVKRALRALGDAVRQLDGPSTRPLFDLADADLPAESTEVPPRLLPMWDNALLAHADRDRLIPPEYRRDVIRSNGDVLPTLLVDGYVAGVWRPVDGGIEATSFRPLPGAAWEGLAEEATALVAFLAGREPRPFARHEWWWSKLPAGETRLLPA